MSPKVSVVIPCYNMGEFIDGAVDSVLAQTMRDYEIVIVDDGSTDARTKELLAGYRRPRTTVIATPNRGPSAARNEGIRRSTGGYVCCLDADDLLEPACLEMTSRVLDETPEAGIAGFWYRTFEEEELERRPTGCSLEEILEDCVLRPSALFRREAWRDAGGYDERFRKGYEDWDFWIGVMERGYRAQIVPEFLFRQRVRKASRNTESDRPEIRAGFMAEMIRKHEAVFRAHAVPVLVGRELLIGELREWTRKQDEAKRWFLERDGAREREIARLDAEVLRLDREARELAAALSRGGGELACLRRGVEETGHELRALRGSKAWRLGCAFQKAKRSPGAALRALGVGAGRRPAGDPAGRLAGDAAPDEDPRR